LQDHPKIDSEDCSQTQVYMNYLLLTDNNQKEMEAPISSSVSFQ